MGITTNILLVPMETYANTISAASGGDLNDFSCKIMKNNESQTQTLFIADIQYAFL